MIFDTVDKLREYAGYNQAFSVIADFLDKNDAAKLELTRYELGDGIFCSVSEYQPGEGGKFEAHRRYADLQYVVMGSEKIEVLPICDASESGGYTDDIEFFAKAERLPSAVVLNAGTFAWFAPQDTHRPCIKAESENVRKIVFKIPLDK